MRKKVKEKIERLENRVSYLMEIKEAYKKEIDGMRNPPEGCVPGPQCKCCRFAIVTAASTTGWVYPRETYICGYGKCQNFVLDKKD